LEAERGSPGPLALFPEVVVPSALPPLSPLQITEADYRMTGLSLNGHPMKHLRALLEPNGIITADALKDGRNRSSVGIAGLVICRQQPETAKGFVFLTLEDETGMVNVIVTPKRFEKFGLLIKRNPLLIVRGILQIDRGAVNVQGEDFLPLRAQAGAEYARSHDFR
jgi:error-prone DNA polymerase